MGYGVALRTRTGTGVRQPRSTRLRAAQQPTRLPPGIASVLSVLSSSAVVVDSEDRVLRASAAARSFGIVKGDRLMVSELLGTWWPSAWWAKVFAALLAS